MVSAVQVLELVLAIAYNIFSLGEQVFVQAKVCLCDYLTVTDFVSLD